jgi:hypothetical protein
MEWQRPRDPSVLDSVETALRTVARPGIHEITWNWRHEIALIAGPAAITVTVGFTLGIGWLIGIAAACLALFAGALLRSRIRRRLIAWAWCVITPHRFRTGCVHAWVQSRHGRLPVVIRTRSTDFGERLLIWCRAGIVSSDLEAARPVIAAACWAEDVRVIPLDRYRHLVILEVVRRDTRPGLWLPVSHEHPPEEVRATRVALAKPRAPAGRRGRGPGRSGPGAGPRR